MRLAADLDAEDRRQRLVGDEGTVMTVADIDATRAMVALLHCESTVPLIWLRALMRMMAPHNIDARSLLRICWLLMQQERDLVAFDRAYGATHTVAHSRHIALE